VYYPRLSNPHWSSTCGRCSVISAESVITQCLLLGSSTQLSVENLMSTAIGRRIIGQPAHLHDEPLALLEGVGAFVLGELFFTSNSFYAYIADGSSHENGQERPLLRYDSGAAITNDQRDFCKHCIVISSLSNFQLAFVSHPTASGITCGLAVSR
jgi:hypothetical protein